MARKIRTVIVDAYDTALVTETPVIDPYRYILETARSFNAPFQAALEKRKILTEPTDLASYADGLLRKSPFVTEERLQDAIQLAGIQLETHMQAYQPAAAWPGFVAQARDYDVKICLGSNLAMPFAANLRKKLPEASAHVLSCDIGKAKPQREFFETCCEIMSVDPDEAVMIGNSTRSDVTGAREAGLADAFWLPEKGRHYSEADYIIFNGVTSLKDVLPKLKKNGMLG